MPTVTATATAPRSAAPLDLSIPRTDAPKRQRCQDRDEAGHCDAAAPRRNPLAPPRLYLPDPILPPIKLLSAAPASTPSLSAEARDSTARLIESKLAEFGAPANVIGANHSAMSRH